MLRDIVLYLNSLLSTVGDNHYLQALIAVLLGLVAARIVFWVVSGAIKLSRRTKTSADDVFLSGLRRPLAVTMILIGLGTASMLLELEGTPRYVTVGVLRTILVIVWIQYALKMARFLCQAAAKQRHTARLIQPETLPLFENATLLILVALAAYLILHIWEVNITAWVASAGIIGLALSFAAKDTLANLFAGVFIVADAPYRLGDYVILDSGERGRITHIGIRSTRLLTRDDVEVTIPNAVMGNAKIVNESGGPHPKFRIRMPLTVCYGEDLDKVRNALMEVATSTQGVEGDPEPRVRYRSFADWGIALELLCWVRLPFLRGQVTDRLLVAIYKKFQEEGITFPYPRQEIYMQQIGGPEAEPD